MEWDKQDTDALMAFKNEVDSDSIRLKEKIKKILLNNRFLIKVIGNEELELMDSDVDDYFNVNIFPYYLIPDPQSNVKVYICYEIAYEDVSRYNNTQKVQQVIFHILVHKGAAIEPLTGICRHDLIGALIQNDFNWLPDFGHLVKDVSTTTDRNYLLKTMTFEQWTDNNIVKTKPLNGIRTSMIINKTG